MSWLLSSIVGSSKPAFPYTVGDAYEEAWGSWTHHRGTAKEEQNAEVSIFKITGSANDPKIVAARNGVKRLRVLRHPSVLQFKDAHEVETDKGLVTLHLVTEPVQPLSVLLADLRQEGGEWNDYFASGLSQIATAVAFLNVDGKKVHGNVCLASVVVTETLDWRLHAFDIMSEFVEGQPPEGLVSHAFLLADQYKPEEVRKGNWEMLNGAPPWAIDAWGVGCLVQEVFSGRKLMRTEDLRELAHIPPVLHKEYQRLLSSAPARRLNPAKILESSLFSNKLVDTLTFLEKLNLKDSADKDLFFRRLNATLDGLPRTVVERKVLPLIASGLEFGSAPGAALQSLLHAARGLAKPQFTARIIPTVIRLFASTDRAMRVALLQCMDAYMELLEPAQMEAVFEQLAAGFGDATAFLRELTLKSMLHVAPKVSQRTLTSSLLKHLAKLQMDDEPAIRANTTICLGNIARYLGEAACKRVLLNAFTRALKDPFPAARAAGLMSLQATIAYYDATEGGLRVLPAITPLTVDPDAKVRAAAFEATDAFLGLLRAHHAQRAPGGSPADDAAAAARPLVCQGEGKTPAPAAGGLLGWASGSVGALAAAMGSPAPDRGKTAGGAPPSSAPKPPPAAARAAKADADEEDTEADRAEAAARARLSKASLAPPPAADGGDGWGLDDDELEDLEQPSPPPPPPPRPAARPAGPRPPAVKPPPKLGAMKLGAKPLGASKAGDLDLEAMLAD